MMQEGDAVRRTLEQYLSLAQQKGQNVGRQGSSRGPGPARRAGGLGGSGAPDASGASEHASGSSTDFRPPSDAKIAARRKLGDATQGRSRRYGWTGPGPDEWDPQNMNNLIRTAITKRGWEDAFFGARIVRSWPEIAGSTIAEHCRAEKLDNRVLFIRTDSTAWATQLRVLQPSLLEELGKRYGGAVKKLHIQGPNAPSWKKGTRHVSGRGPRDTYG